MNLTNEQIIDMAYEKGIVETARSIERIVRDEMEASQAERLDKLTTELAGIAYMYDDNGCVDFGSDSPDDVIRFIKADFGNKILTAQDVQAESVTRAVEARDAEIKAILDADIAETQNIIRSEYLRPEMGTYHIFERRDHVMWLKNKLFPAPEGGNNE